MDQLAIDVIEGFLGVPLIAPAAIHEIDSREIARALDSLDDERIAAWEEVENAREKLIDEHDERLEEIIELIQDAMRLCETCQTGQACASHEALKLWVAGE